MSSRIVSPRRYRALVASVAWRMAAALAAVTGALVGEAAEAPTSAAGSRQRMVDPAVVPAGGAGCRACGPTGCRHAHGHHAGCREGVCVPYCPVRPQQFGYYGTRWRKWPGQDVVRVSGEAAVAPVQPPRSEVPGAGEESLTPPGGDAPADGTETQSPAPMQPAPQEPAPIPAPPRQPEPMPPAEPAPVPDEKPAPPVPEADEEPQAEPEPMPEQEQEPLPERQPEPAKPEPTPDAKPAPQRPEDENLFEVLSGAGWRARRRFAVGPATAADADRPVRPAAHAGPADARDVPPVSFDPAAETMRLRKAR